MQSSYRLFFVLSVKSFPFFYWGTQDRRLFTCKKLEFYLCPLQRGYMLGLFLK